MAPDNKINPLIDHLNSGDFGTVIEQSVVLIQLYPKDFLARHVYGAALAATSDHKAAIKQLSEAVRLNPNAIEPLNALGMSLRADGQFQKAFEIFSNALAIAPHIPTLRNNYGNTLKDLNRHEDAIKEFQRAIAENPNFSVAYKNLAATYTEIGNTNSAIEAYETAIKLAPSYADAHYGLASLKRFAEGDAQLPILEKLRQNSELPNKDRASIAFSLAKANEDLKAYENAFKLYVEANAIRRADITYSIEKDRKTFVALKKAFTETVTISPTLISDPRPIFIVGMPRSGTTLVEQVLASHSDVHGAGELPELNAAIETTQWRKEGLSQHVVAIIREQYVNSVAKLCSNTRVVTDKMPLNFLWIGFIVAALPEAKIIHVSRDIRATSWSIFKQNFGSSGNGYAYDLNEIVGFANLYNDYMKFWCERFPDKIYTLNYEHFTEDVEAETRRLISFADLGWQNSCLNFFNTKRVVSTASSTQVRQPIYKGSSQDWRRYEEQLARYFDQIINTCRE